MKLYEGGFLFLIIASIFGYGVYHLDKNTDGGKNPINFEVVKEEVKEDFHEVEAYFAAGGSANHNRYND